MIELKSCYIILQKVNLVLINKIIKLAYKPFFAHLTNAAKEPSGVDVLLGGREGDECVPDDVADSEPEEARVFSSHDPHEKARREPSNHEPDARQARDPRGFAVGQCDVTEKQKMIFF